MVDFSLLVKLLPNAAELCWKYYIVLTNITWLPVFAKFISVGFLPPTKYLLFSKHQLSDLLEEKKVEPKKVMCNNSYF